MRRGINSSHFERGPHPLFFVSIASKGFSSAVSLLFATLAGSFTSVADKGVALRSLRANRSLVVTWQHG